MKSSYLVIIWVLCFWQITSCSNNSGESIKYKSADYGGRDENGMNHQYIFEDGEYCAEVKYHNPNTGKTSSWTLPVEIEDNKLIKIEFTNGGWLDDTHFTPPKPNENQYFEFTDDRGYEYEVSLLEDDEQCNN